MKLDCEFTTLTSFLSTIYFMYGNKIYKENHEINVSALKKYKCHKKFVTEIVILKVIINFWK